LLELPPPFPDFGQSLLFGEECKGNGMLFSITGMRGGVGIRAVVTGSPISENTKRKAEHIGAL
jgi:hypothetical protein